MIEDVIYDEHNKQRSKINTKTNLHRPSLQYKPSDRRRHASWTSNGDPQRVSLPHLAGRGGDYVGGDGGLGLDVRVARQLVYARLGNGLIRRLAMFLEVLVYLACR